MFLFPVLSGEGGYTARSNKNKRPGAPPPFPLLDEGHCLCSEDPMDATINAPLASTIYELPIRVREAAVFLGVSPQTVYLWVGAKADSPSPRNGSQHPVLEIGVGALPRAVQAADSRCRNARGERECAQKPGTGVRSSEND